jgi:pimeloyl-ACP methyl ester carboxylesterase
MPRRAAAATNVSARHASDSRSQPWQARGSARPSALRGRAARPDYRPVLDQLAVPGLIVVGCADAFTTRADADDMAARLKARLVWMDGIGHMPNLEAPESFNRELVAFLRQVANR